ncbi:ergothioneine biosynthesis protein EgtB [Flammeovirgaceae bacterium SG7u.111]|nr:ergothioneine biosynthesis protein EgtB [Flammeovirgaceae bacterium SG7u.132]WPO35405.1 ergothioneine biosynthesis protein EgtB [Flammeovirgaceae bacterium SG7u.111]
MKTFTETLIADYQQVRNRTISLCEPLKPEDMVVQPIEDVSPPKWHLGHTTWFFENFILAEKLPGYTLFNPRFNYLFNSYYESQGERILRSNRGNLTRPTSAEIVAYRKQVDAGMERWLSEYFDGSEEESYLVEIGLQHEMQHQELLVTDLKYILGNNPLFPAYTSQGSLLPKVMNDGPSFFEIPEGVYEIGHEGDGFRYDNETGRHKVFLHPYQLSKKLVTNGEFMGFIEEGGYKNHELWLADGWAWVNGHEKFAPLYWFNVKGEWMHYTLRGLEPVNPNEPVTHINYYEADAFANWKGMRLPTEFEWEVACKKFASEVVATDNILEKNNFHPIAQKGEEYQFLGNVWQWTSSAYLPYPYYEKAPGALGEYNGKFMVNQHVLRGASCATPKVQARATYRNFFQPDKQWQFTGIRLAKSL